MTGWDIGTEVLKPVMGNKALAGDQRKPFKIVESPGKKYCVYVYGVDEPRMGYTFANFMVLKTTQGKAKILLKSDGNFIENWIDNSDNISWSEDSKYVIIDIFPGITKYHTAYRDAKLIVDVKAEKFSILPISGSSRQQGLRIDKNGKVELFVRKRETESNISLFIESAETKTSRLKWVKLSRFNTAISMLENGYFGDIVGYKNAAVNIRFKNGYIPWPYKGIVKRRPK